MPLINSVNSPEALLQPLLLKNLSKKHLIRPPITLYSCFSPIPASKLGFSRSLCTTPLRGLQLSALRVWACICFQLNSTLPSDTALASLCLRLSVDAQLVLLAFWTSLGTTLYIYRQDRKRDLIFTVTISASFAPIREQRNLIPAERSITSDNLRL